MIPKELVICRVDLTGHSMEGYYYVAGADDGEPQIQPEKSIHEAIEVFSGFYKSVTGKDLDRLTKKLLLFVGYCSLPEDF